MVKDLCKIPITILASLTLMLTSEGMVAWMTIPGEVFATLVTYILDFNPQSLGRIVFTSVASVDYVCMDTAHLSIC